MRDGVCGFSALLPKPQLRVEWGPQWVVTHLLTTMQRGILQSICQSVSLNLASLYQGQGFSTLESATLTDAILDYVDVV